ncbi:MAG: fatty acid desaturase [Planctomycetales bacterium]|nr:fatty acid desaturase [Planctomycetales bacterium]
MTTVASADTRLSSSARQEVADLFGPRPWIYWTDFLLSLTVGYASATIYLSGPFPSSRTVASLVIAVVALYRVSMFMHEIVHFRRGQMRSFSITWNLLAGVPMLIPSFMYESHQDHHNVREYGTRQDGEYLPLCHTGWSGLVVFLGQVFLQPVLVFLRFLLGTPVSALHPRWRQWILQHASSFVINFRYRRTLPADAPRGWWLLLEWCCFLRAALIVVMIVLDIFPPTRGLKIYFLACCTLGLNHLRTLGAHRYTNPGFAVTHEEQFHDSTNIRGGLLTELLCPLGLRYHALHHLLPTLPYHNLSRAHRRLMEQLPESSAYQDAEYPSFASVVSRLMRTIRTREGHHAPDAEGI